jgi:hypothetical protein
LPAHVRQPTLNAQDLECPPFKRTQADKSLCPRDLVGTRLAAQHAAAPHHRDHTADRSSSTNFRQPAAEFAGQARFDGVGHQRAVVARHVSGAERPAGTKPQERRPSAPCLLRASVRRGLRLDNLTCRRLRSA